MPGMVDAHVHFMDPAAPEREDFPAGSAAAARSGVTTVIEHTHAGPVRTPEDLQDKISYLQGRSSVDFGLAAHAWPEGPPVEPVWRAGAAFIKAFTCTTHGVPGHDAAHLQSLFQQVARAGAICLVHCEDESLTGAAERRLREEGREDGGIVIDWRSRGAELVAATVTALLAAESAANVVIAHASHRAIVEMASRERGPGRIHVETCPQYLTLLEEEVLELGALRKFTPPARARGPRDLSLMWVALAEGAVDYVSSDHAPATRAQKRQGSIWDVHFGLPGVDTTFSVLLDGAARGLVSYERVVQLYSEAPARIYGLKGKGRLEPGADADLVLVDPAQAWQVKDEDVLSKAGWSPFSGRTLLGRSVATYLRGVPLQEGSKLIEGPRGGRFIPGAGAVR